jgi:glycosyltransferase involved in cell wall biosynthesis
MKVSVITATFNSAATIGDTLRSVQQQTHPDIEHIVIDGGSKDDTMAILEANRPHIAKLVSERDNGLYDAINKGIGMATGELIAILHSDDSYFDERVIADYVERFSAARCDAVYADLVYVSGSDPSKIVRKWTSGDYRQGDFLKGWMPPHPTFIVRRSVYEKFGLYNTMFRTAADYELMLRFIHKNRISLAYLPRYTVRMRTGGVSNRTIGARIRANIEDRKAWRINGLTPGIFTLFLKPLRKLSQFTR